MMRRVHVWVSGRVQGVSYRAFAREKAMSLGLGGWVRNRADGRVELLAEGDAERVAEFLDWCRTGPPLAKVEDCRVVEEAPRGDLGPFHIRREP